MLEPHGDRGVPCAGTLESPALNPPDATDEGEDAFSGEVGALPVPAAALEPADCGKITHAEASGIVSSLGLRLGTSGRGSAIIGANPR